MAASLAIVVSGCSSSGSSNTSDASIDTTVAVSGDRTTVDSTAMVSMADTTVSSDTTMPAEHDMAAMTPDTVTDSATDGTGMASMAGMVSTDATAPTADGYTLRLDQPSTAPGAAQSLSFVITTSAGAPLTEYQVEQTKQLHLIVVRADLSGYQHLHPTLGTDGHWSTPVNVTNPGKWRIIADFTPIADAKPGARIALGTDLLVNGAGTDQPTPTPSTSATTDGYNVTMSSLGIAAGHTTPITFTITKNGANVTDLVPYLGSFGHLVAIRSTDLGYLHLHPVAEANDPAATAGPTIEFEADIPTAGLHGLYLQFATATGVHTATFALDVP